MMSKCAEGGHARLEYQDANMQEKRDIVDNDGFEMDLDALAKNMELLWSWLPDLHFLAGSESPVIL